MEAPVAILLLSSAVTTAFSAYKDYEIRSDVFEAYQAAEPVQEAVAEYVTTNDGWPDSLRDLGYTQLFLEDESGKFSVALENDGVVAVILDSLKGEGRRLLILQPSRDGESVSWHCSGRNIPDKHLPSACRGS